MRLFELLLLLSVLLLLAVRLIPRLRAQTGVTGFASVLVVILTAAHVLIEGARWQMLGPYLVAAALVVRELRLWRPDLSTRPERRSTALTVAGVGGAVLLLTLSVALGVVLPVFALPAPDGPHPVGTVTFHWVDESRRGVYTENEDAPRELMVQVWYPAQSASGPRERWLDNPAASIPLLAFWGELPAFALGHLDLVRTNSIVDAPPAGDEAPYPVVLYVHGWGGTRDINQDQLEMLASHGYIVVSADHTYGALVTTFPDGRVAPYNPDALPEDAPDPIYDAAAVVLVDTYAADTRFILDQLEALNAGGIDSRLTSRLDLARVGLFAHSTGGGAIVEVCALDARCTSLFGQDAWVIPVSDEMIEGGLTQPLVIMNSETWTSGENRARQGRLADASQGPVIWIEVEGTSHYDFVMVPFFSPLAADLGLKGPLPAERVLAINHTYLRAFFDWTLKDIPTDLLDGPSPQYPAADVRRQTP